MKKAHAGIPITVPVPYGLSLPYIPPPSGNLLIPICDRAQMMHNAHLRTLIEEEKAKANRVKSGAAEFDDALAKNDALASLSHHKKNINDLARELDTNLKTGLSTEAAREKLKIYGLNKLREPEQHHWILRFILELFTMMACILWVGSILSFIGYGLDSSDPSNVFYDKITA